jgi:drug/metabolite transporter (DMT)-like permease
MWQGRLEHVYFTKLIWAAILGYLVFAEIPTIWTWIGGIVIFGGSLYVALRERQLQIQLRQNT